jgi:hypothetical protein
VETKACKSVFKKMIDCSMNCFAAITEMATRVSDHFPTVPKPLNADYVELKVLCTGKHIV